MVGQQRILLNPSNFRDFSGSRDRSTESVKVHDYTHHQSDLDYAFEPADKPNQSYMTGWGKKINSGDRIMLCQKNEIHAYSIKKIDYYANPSNVWIALLERHD